MSNIAKNKINAQQLEFIEEMSRVMLPWGMPVTAARIFSFLLLQETTVGLDDICDKLSISKSTASVSARELERAGMVKRHSVRGSKKVLYSIGQGHTVLMLDKAKMLGQMAAMLRSNTEVAGNPIAEARMLAMAQFCQNLKSSLIQVTQDISTDWNEDGPKGNKADR
ncbi:GbsR/MarR family transcriptional regulator [Halioxenophilus aromaticivorans]|uniref:HTH marR-type domain-containing protein n=1 Tax=Halioxenophilus aromaticivorans TaxID=1306992 RepID=A0AAV3U4Y4_9ALTE